MMIVVNMLFVDFQSPSILGMMRMHLLETRQLDR
jgi:hypothetical protein